MNINILVFNIVFYFITLLFYYEGKLDPSSSLGYGFFIIFFWCIALLTLIVLLSKKIIQPKTILDKIGIVTATPVLFIVISTFIMSLNESATSVWYFDKDNHLYKVNTFDYKGRGAQTRKRIEYYKSKESIDPGNSSIEIETWLKDSTWVYFSRLGDTSKIEKYKEGLQIK